MREACTSRVFVLRLASDLVPEVVPTDGVVKLDSASSAIQSCGQRIRLQLNARHTDLGGALDCALARLQTSSKDKVRALSHLIAAR